MRLSPECIRSVMLTLEKELVFTCRDDVLARNCLSLDQICALLPAFSKEDVFYTIYNLDQAGYLDISIQWTGGGEVYHCSVKDITFPGHEFIARIRDAERWKKVKGAIGAIRDYSLSAIASVSEGITSAAISAYISSHQ